LVADEICACRDGDGSPEKEKECEKEKEWAHGAKVNLMEESKVCTRRCDVDVDPGRCCLFLSVAMCQTSDDHLVSASRPTSSVTATGRFEFGVSIVAKK